ncbi:hypothetical protein C8Q73DRAFT_197231 [Cubamyces lactineus]|nr:hypothetical protein C8Q73DRAFT_197231 [Cubamyces lactineus]
MNRMNRTFARGISRTASAICATSRFPHARFEGVLATVRGGRKVWALLSASLWELPRSRLGPDPPPEGRVVRPMMVSCRIVSLSLSKRPETPWRRQQEPEPAVAIGRIQESASFRRSAERRSFGIPIPSIRLFLLPNSEAYCAPYLSARTLADRRVPPARGRNSSSDAGRSWSEKGQMPIGRGRDLARLIILQPTSQSPMGDCNMRTAPPLGSANVAAGPLAQGALARACPQKGVHASCTRLRWRSRSEARSPALALSSAGRTRNMSGLPQDLVDWEVLFRGCADWARRGGKDGGRKANGKERPLMDRSERSMIWTRRTIWRAKVQASPPRIHRRTHPAAASASQPSPVSSPSAAAVPRCFRFYSPFRLTTVVCPLYISARPS